MSGKEVKILYLELLYLGGYFKATTKFKVPFKLSDITMMRKYPSTNSRQKGTWLKNELQKT